VNSIHEPKPLYRNLLQSSFQLHRVKNSRNEQYGSSGKKYGLCLLAPGMNVDRCTEYPDMLYVVFPDYSGKFQDITLIPITIASVYVSPILSSLTVSLFDTTFYVVPRNKAQKFI